jgi:hypothetical protein
MFASGAASAATLTVDASSSVWGSDNGPGSLAPASFSFTAQSGQVLTFQSVTGSTNCCGSTPDANADGLGGLIGTGNTDITYRPGRNDGISSIQVNGHQMFLTGVFVDASNLPVASAPESSAPARLEYNTGGSSALTTDDTSFAPELNQAFFIGDGRVGFGGAIQSFIVPDDADTLLLGFADAASFVGFPNFYGDNVGSLTATFDVAPVNVVPLPAGLPLMLAGLATFGWMRRRSA